MLRRVEPDENVTVAALHVGASASESVVPVVAEAELETALLPHDHPRWVKDAVAVSQRARDLIARLRPVALRVLCYWDHRLRSIVVGGTCVTVDPSGCYRIN